MKKRLGFYFLFVIAIVFFDSFGIAGEEHYTNSIGMEFQLINPGSFMMGAHNYENGSEENEKPRHKVTITRAFYLGKYEVTQEQWLSIMEDNPSTSKHPKKPVANVSFLDTHEFIKRLNQKEGVKKYRLPTEAEWEYAARAGSDRAYSYGEDPDAKELHKYAWYEKNSQGQAQIVGKLKPNTWGLHDMHGNLREWCQDSFEKYSKSSRIDPIGRSSRYARPVRGGAWYDTAYKCRSASRYKGTIENSSRINGFGFRIAFWADYECKSKQREAKQGLLGNIAKNEEAYRAEHGTYTKKIESIGKIINSEYYEFTIKNASQSKFKAVATSRAPGISGGGAGDDIWSIDETLNLIHLNNGCGDE